MNAQEIVIPYTPRYPQPQIHNAFETHRFCVLVTHRQMGKTVCAVNHMIKQAVKNSRPNPRYFYVAPFFKQAKMIAWDYLKRYTRPCPGVKVLENTCEVILVNGASLRIVGADNPDALRGSYADGVVVDEFAQIKPDVLTEIIRPMLVSRKGWCVVLGTPKGQNQFYSYFLNVQKRVAQGKKEYWAGVYRADETGVISAEELDRIREECPAAIFRQEYLCDFTASADNALIAIDDVAAALKRFYKKDDLRGAPKILGVDVARFGADRSVIFRRQGLQAFEPQIFRKTDNMTLAARVAQEITNFRPDAVFIDAGAGAGVIDRLRQLNFDVTEVPFGGSPSQPGRYVNKRSEMWGEMAAWIKAGGALPDAPELAQDLTVPVYDFDPANRLRLEPKEKIKDRTGTSPDLGDALALTFAYPVQTAQTYGADGNKQDSYDMELIL